SSECIINIRVGDGNTDSNGSIVWCFAIGQIKYRWEIHIYIWQYIYIHYCSIAHGRNTIIANNISEGIYTREAFIRNIGNGSIGIYGGCSVSRLLNNISYKNIIAIGVKII